MPRRPGAGQLLSAAAQGLLPTLLHGTDEPAAHPHDRHSGDGCENSVEHRCCHGCGKAEFVQGGLAKTDHDDGGADDPRCPGVRQAAERVADVAARGGRQGGADHEDDAGEHGSCQHDDEIVNEDADRVDPEHAECQLEKRQRGDGERDPHEVGAQIGRGATEHAGQPAAVEQVVGAGTDQETVDGADDATSRQAAGEQDEHERPDLRHALDDGCPRVPDTLVPAGSLRYQ